MKNIKILLLIPLVVLLLTACMGKDKLVLVSTEYGDIKIKLYEETPLHKENFLKLVEEGFYDSLIFHRVIKEFMIQGGDPDSKNAEPGTQLGNGGPGYQVDAEFVEQLYHKKGALAAARQGDQMNPEKKSSGSQFYIVQGRVFSHEELDGLEEKMNMSKKQEIIMKYITAPENAELKRRADSFYMNRLQVELEQIIAEVEEAIKPEYEAAELYKLSDEQREVYSTLGGTPHLDGGYTVFGEVVEGLDVIDKIATLETDQFDRPTKDIIISMKLVRK